MINFVFDITILRGLWFPHSVFFQLTDIPELAQTVTVPAPRLYNQYLEINGTRPRKTSVKSSYILEYTNALFPFLYLYPDFDLLILQKIFYDIRTFFRKSTFLDFLQDKIHKLLVLAITIYCP